jgi:hypothetical protein
MTEQQKTDKRYFKVSDELIGMIRELVQLALITGTNIVDHMRALVVEETPDGRFITVSPEYVQAYNDMIEKLHKEAEERIAEMQKRVADEGPPLFEESVPLSLDSGKAKN